MSLAVAILGFVFEGVFFFLLQEGLWPDMRILAKFFKDAGYYAGGSVILAIILFAVSIWEHAKNKNVDTWWLWFIAVVLWCYGCAVAWYREYKSGIAKDAEIEAAKSPLPLIQGVLSNVRFGGQINTSVNIGNEWQISSAATFDITLCNHKPRETNLQKIELDGFELTPPIRFGTPVLVSPQNTNAVFGVVLPDGKAVNLPNLLVSVRVRGFQHKSQIPPVDLKKLKVFAIDGFDIKHRIEVGDGETLRFRSPWEGVDGPD
ncbi:MAG: hypothetical protein WAN65_11505 [Candidatus Sulfotelmatobacter sp.]